MVLGELIRDLGTGERLVELLNHADQSALVMRLEQAALRHNESIGDYASASIERFINRANDEAWLALMSAVERANAQTAPAHASQHGPHNDLGAVCLRIMLDWALREDDHYHKHQVKQIKPAYDEDYGGSSPCFLHEI